MQHLEKLSMLNQRQLMSSSSCSLPAHLQPFLDPCCPTAGGRRKQQGRCTDEQASSWELEGREDGGVDEM